MKILFTASECVPFIKTGGLADVVGALAPVLAKQGHDVRVMLPLYAAVPKQYVDQMTHVTDFEVALGWRRQYCGIELLEKDGVKFYFVDNKFYFGRPYIYGMGGDEYERFGFFCRAALNALPLLDFQPDVIHAHDWQSGMVPALLKIQYAPLPFFANIKTMFTIHNLQYQGVFGIRAGSGRQPVDGRQAGVLRLRELHEGCAGVFRHHHHRQPVLCRGNSDGILRRAAGWAAPRAQA